ncbi:RsiV family protein [Pasteurella sp. P03HT]
MHKSILLFPIILLTACFDNVEPNRHLLPDLAYSFDTNEVVAIQSDFHILAQRLQCMNAQNETRTGGEYCASLRLISQKTNVEWLNQFLDGLALSILTETKSSKQGIEQLVQNWFNDVLPELESSQSWDYSREIHFIGQRGRMATFSVITSYYTGGANGLYDTQFLNIDLIDRVIYRLEDLLISPDRLPMLTQLLCDKNMARLHHLNAIPHHINSDEFEAIDNFVFTINGLTFRYPVYSLGSYAEGEIDLVLPYSQLRDIIKPEFLH